MADEQWIETTSGSRLNARHVVSVAPADGGPVVTLVTGEKHVMALPQQPVSTPVTTPAAAPANATGATSEAAVILSTIATELDYVTEQIGRAGRVLDVESN